MQNCIEIKEHERMARKKKADHDWTQLLEMEKELVREVARGNNDCLRKSADRNAEISCSASWTNAHWLSFAIRRSSEVGLLLLTSTNLKWISWPPPPWSPSAHLNSVFHRATLLWNSLLHTQSESEICTTISILVCTKTTLAPIRTPT